MKDSFHCIDKLGHPPICLICFINLTRLDFQEGVVAVRIPPLCEERDLVSTSVLRSKKKNPQGWMEQEAQVNWEKVKMSPLNLTKFVDGIQTTYLGANLLPRAGQQQSLS